MKKRIAALGAVGAAALLPLTAGAAQATTWHGPYTTKAECVHWAGVYEQHGYVLTEGCARSAGGLGNWWFQTR